MVLELLEPHPCVFRAVFVFLAPAHGLIDYLGMRNRKFNWCGLTLIHGWNPQGSICADCNDKTITYYCTTVCGLWNYKTILYNITITQCKV